MSGRSTRLWQPIAAAGGVAVLVSALGALATDLSPWYYALSKPSWQPPDWLFGPVWTTIFALAAISATLAWRQSGDRTTRRRIIGLFALNAVLNVLWSWLFFRLHRPDFAVIEVIALWLSIVFLIRGLWPLSHTASELLLPYLAWVSFAAFLNFTVVRLNAPFT